MLSDQEVLEQIDQWYFRRIEQAYTPEVERRILASLEHVLQSHPEIKEELGSLADKKLRPLGSSGDGHHLVYGLTFNIVFLLNKKKTPKNSTKVTTTPI